MRMRTAAAGVTPAIYTPNDDRQAIVKDISHRSRVNVVLHLLRGPQLDIGGGGGWGFCLAIFLYHKASLFSP